MKRLILCLILVNLIPAVQAKDANKSLETLSKLAPLLISNDQIGLWFSRGLEQEYGLLENEPQISNRLQQVGSKILSVISEPNAKYDFAALSSNDFNAFSVYGGHIRVFKGLLYDTRNSDDELAAATAHEIAHQEKGHNKQTVKTFKIATLLGMTNLEEKMPAIFKLGVNAVLAKRNRKFERESDWFGLQYMDRAGYDIRGFIALCRRIEAEDKLARKQFGNDISKNHYALNLSTHPEPKDRVDMAEDYLFVKKYGRTFKPDENIRPTIKPISNPITHDRPIIVAHPSLWDTSLTTTTGITGVGLFNPRTITNEKQEVEFYLKALSKGNFVAATADNDYHNTPEKYKKIDLQKLVSHYDHTFICASSFDKNGLVEGIKKGKAYASFLGTRIQNPNFCFGGDYPKVQNVNLKFSLKLPSIELEAPKVKVYRDNKEVAELKKVNSTFERDPVYQFEDKEASVGFHWYVLYIPNMLITSPITAQITKDAKDPAEMTPDPEDNWHMGIIHCHSDYSDGRTTLTDIWSKKGDNEFIFMTDHAGAFDKEKFEKYVKECQEISSLLIPGVEYSLSGSGLRHLLVLGLDTYLAQETTDEQAFFGQGQEVPDKVLIKQGPVHLGDDVKGSQIEDDATFDYAPQDAVLKLRVKGTPNKDPIVWVNRVEVGRITTTDDKWHWYELRVPKEYLRQGRNLFHIEAYIPDRWQTFDDCEVADVYILKK